MIIRLFLLNRELMFNCTDNWSRIELNCGRQKDANSCGCFLLMVSSVFYRQNKEKKADVVRACNEDVGQ